MAQWLNGSRVVGVESAGTIAIVVGVQGAPSPLLGDLLVGLDGRPIVITHLKPHAPDRSPAEPPTQIELRVRSSDEIHEALDWLADASTEPRHTTTRTNIGSPRFTPKGTVRSTV
jgi:hypothetical protein